MPGRERDLLEDLGIALVRIDHEGLRRAWALAQQWRRLADASNDPRDAAWLQGATGLLEAAITRENPGEVKGRVCLGDGTITPCWSYEGHDELWSRKKSTTGFSAQLFFFSLIWVLNKTLA
jgi:hypothetical protein